MTKFQAPLPYRKTEPTHLTTVRRANGQIMERDLIAVDFPTPTALEVFADVCQAFDITAEQITTKNRGENNVGCKRIFCYVANVLTNERSGAISLLINKHRGTYLSHVKYCINMFESNDARFMKRWNEFLHRSKIWDKYYKLHKQHQNEQKRNSTIS